MGLFTLFVIRSERFELNKHYGAEISCWPPPTIFINHEVNARIERLYGANPKALDEGQHTCQKVRMTLQFGAGTRDFLSEREAYQIFRSILHTSYLRMSKQGAKPNLCFRVQTSLQPASHSTSTVALPFLC